MAVSRPVRSSLSGGGMSGAWSLCLVCERNQHFVMCGFYNVLEEPWGAVECDDVSVGN